MANLVRNITTSEFLTHTEQELVAESYIKNQQLYDNKKTILPNYFKFDSIQIPLFLLEKSLQKLLNSFTELATEYGNTNNSYLYTHKKVYNGIYINANIIIQVYTSYFNKTELNNQKENYVYKLKQPYLNNNEEIIEYVTGIDFIIPPIDIKNLQEFQKNISNSIYDLIKSQTEFTIKKETKLHIIENNPETGYELVEFNINKDDDLIDIELLYGKDFNKFYNLFLKKINETKKGITIFNGEPGTGKSSFIRKLIREGKLENKIITYAPIEIMLNLTNSTFINFLKKLKYKFPNNKNLLLICEDGEKLLLKRNLNNNDGISSILNFSDGLLNDFFNIQIIITHNQDNEIIDPGIIRKGRLIAIREFKKLTIDESEKLIDFLNINYDPTDEMTLSQIFHLKNEYDIENDNILFQGIKNKSNIGFIGTK